MYSVIVARTCGNYNVLPLIAAQLIKTDDHADDRKQEVYTYFRERVKHSCKSVYLLLKMKMKMVERW